MNRYEIHRRDAQKITSGRVMRTRETKHLSGDAHSSAYVNMHESKLSGGPMNS